MYVVAVNYITRPEFAEMFKSRVVKLAAETLRQEPACVTFDVCFDPDDDIVVFLYQVFETPEDFLAHLDSPHASEFAADTGDWVAGRDERSYRRL